MDETRRYFIEIEKAYRASLERQFNLTVADTPGYPYNLHRLWIDSGIVKKPQVREAITRDFIKGKHYHEESGDLQITETCYLILMFNFRSKRGIDIRHLPATLKILTEEFYQYEQRRKANTRNPKSRGCEGQMELELG